MVAIDKNDETPVEVERSKAFITTDIIRHIISSPVYRGTLRVRCLDSDQRADTSKPQWEEFKSKHQPLVDDQIWFAANRTLKPTSGRKRCSTLGKIRGPGLLQGLLICGCCNSAMAPGSATRRKKSGESHRYYRCSQLVKGGDLSTCTTRQISCDAIESAMLTMIQSVKDNPASFARLGFDPSNKRRDAEIASTNLQLMRVNEAIQKHGDSITKFVTFVQSSTSDTLHLEFLSAAEQAKRDIAELERERIQLEGRLHKLSARNASISDLSTAFGEVGRALMMSEPDGKINIYRTVTMEVVLRRATVASANGEFRKRTFRMNVEFRTDALMQFGIKEINPMLIRGGYSNIELKITFEIHSNKQRQQVMLLEHGYSTVSTSYMAVEDPKLSCATEISENPIQRAIRWQTIIRGGGPSC